MSFLSVIYNTFVQIYTPPLRVVVAPRGGGHVYNMVCVRIDLTRFDTDYVLCPVGLPHNKQIV